MDDDSKPPRESRSTQDIPESFGESEWWFSFGFSSRRYEEGANEWGEMPPEIHEHSLEAGIHGEQYSE